MQLWLWCPNLYWLVAARIVSGVLGATFPVANAMVADISSDDDRAKNLGILAAGAGLGYIAGPAIGGTLGEISIADGISLQL